MSHRCEPPLHADPGHTLANSPVFYLVTSPDAKPPGRGLYTSWPSAQRAGENVPRGGGLKFSTAEAALPTWYAGCDAGEHDHPGRMPRLPPTSPSTMSSPPMTSTPRKAQPSAPPSPSPLRRGTFTAAPEGRVFRGGVSTAAALRTAARTGAFHTAPPLPTGVAPRDILVRPRPSFAVQSGGIVHSNLEAAITDFESAGADGGATMCITSSPRVAAHFAMGLSLKDAEDLAQAEGAINMFHTYMSTVYTESTVGARRRRERLVSQLQEALGSLQPRQEQEEAEAVLDRLDMEERLHLDEEEGLWQSFSGP
ncbi:hypothetical protein C8R47DRAFT_1225747 [Mycena vitilis]|nr:hypothetical protein C8R47DRAFT_1225747 [Mycena vitilis]